MAKKSTTTAKKTTARKKAGIKSEFDLLTGEYVSTEEREREAAEKAAQEQAIKDEFKVRRLGPFDIMKMMFSNKDEFDHIKDSALKENYFIINRRFAILFPMQAAQLSLMGINEAQVVRFWANFARTKCGGRFPQELYLKGEKSTLAQVNIDDLDDELIAGYMRRHNLSRRDLIDMLRFFNQETVDDIRHYVSIYSPEEQAKLFAKEKSSKKKFESDD